MTTQDLINTLKQGKPMTDKLMREIVRELEGKSTQEVENAAMDAAYKERIIGLRAELAALKDAVKPVAVWYTRSKRHFPDEFRPRDTALEYDGPLGRMKVICLELDALAALVGEE